MAKRKRVTIPEQADGSAFVIPKKSKSQPIQEARSTQHSNPVTIQIVAGSYDRVLHGISATVSEDGKTASFADTFLFNAHTSAIRCLALSPPSAPAPGKGQRVMLATGSTDERINVYNLSAHPLSNKPSADAELLSSLAPRPVRENSRNRELGTLLHHSSTVTRLAFPTRSKLLSGSEDCTIAVTRTRDWSLLSTIKTPKPVVLGRPSGDTAPMGGTPSGVNDFAIHPSLKLMVSVSKGERSMRLWNLVTGKKAGVLNFGRDLLQDVGEGKHSTGEGRSAVWGSCGGEDEFAVGFDRNIVVFGMDSTPKCKVLADNRNKVHKFCYMRREDGEKDEDTAIIAVATEDGRVLFCSTRPDDLVQREAKEGSKSTPVPTALLVSQLGGKEAGVTGRIKDFVALPQPGSTWLIITGGSDGVMRMWKMSAKDVKPKAEALKQGSATGPRQVGQLLGTYETQNRITCLDAFTMIPRPEGMDESEDEVEDEDEGSDEE